MTLRPEHLRIDAYQPAIPTTHPNYAVRLRITHTPTGIVVEGEASETGKYKSQLQLREALLHELTNKVIEHKVNEWHESESSLTVYEYLGMTFEQYADWVNQHEFETSFDTFGISH
jgi:protein subunit release factor A